MHSILVGVNEVLIPIVIHTRFNARKVPATSISTYITRIVENLECDSAVYIAALIFIDRVVARNPSFLVSSLNVHR